MFTVNKLQIELPDSIFSSWSTDTSSQISDLLNSNLLTLRFLRPSDYTPITEGEGVNLTTGLSSSFVRTTSKRLGFRATVVDRREDLRLLFQELIDYQLSTGCGKAQPVVVRDYFYHYDRADKARGYRLRTGFVVGQLENLTGTVVAGSFDRCGLVETINDPDIRYGGGFGFRFMEAEPIC